MEGAAPRRRAERGYLVGLVGVLGLEVAGALYQVATGIAVPGMIAFATLFVLACLVRVHGFRGTLAFVAAVLAIPYASEFLGVLTGVPFGAYAYTGLQPWAFGLVPFFILIAWIHIGYLTMATTTLGFGRSSPWLAPLDGVLAVAWDLIVDPLAVRAGFWVWFSPGGFYGVPVSNFLGWFLVVTLMSLVVRSAWARDPLAPAQMSRTMAVILPTLLFGSSVSLAAVAVASGLPLAALLGLLVLTPATSLAWYRAASLGPGAVAPSPWTPVAARPRALRSDRPPERV